MRRHKTNKQKQERGYGLNSLLFFMYKIALPVWEQYTGEVPPGMLEKLEKEGDWPSGVAAAVMERLSRDKKLRQQLRESQQ